MAPGNRYCRNYKPRPMLKDSSTGRCLWTPPQPGLISTQRTSPATQGASSNHTKPWVEPPDHALGRSRGGLTSKVHQLVDGHGLPLATIVSPGQANDAPALIPLVEQIEVPRLRRGRARTRPRELLGDKAYSSRAIRTYLRDRAITATIAEPSDQARHRKNRGSRGGRPPAFNAER